jgi:hypothetical protein
LAIQLSQITRHRHRQQATPRKDINGDTSAELPIGVTILGGKIGSIKTGATEIGKRGVNYRTGESARTLQRAEHLTTRMSGAMWNVARAQQDYRGLVATMQLLEKNQSPLKEKEMKTRPVTEMKRAAAAIGN